MTESSLMEPPGLEVCDVATVLALSLFVLYSISEKKKILR